MKRLVVLIGVTLLLLLWRRWHGWGLVSAGASWSWSLSLEVVMARVKVRAMLMLLMSLKRTLLRPALGMTSLRIA